jgi:hypothetical protein
VQSAAHGTPSSATCKEPSLGSRQASMRERCQQLRMRSRSCASADGQTGSGCSRPADLLFASTACIRLGRPVHHACQTGGCCSDADERQHTHCKSTCCCMSVTGAPSSCPLTMLCTLASDVHSSCQSPATRATSTARTPQRHFVCCPTHMLTAVDRWLDDVRQLPRQSMSWLCWLGN